MTLFLHLPYQYHQMKKNQKSPLSQDPLQQEVSPQLQEVAQLQQQVLPQQQVTNEDLSYLEEGEFLDDVIIDFYLK